MSQLEKLLSTLEEEIDMDHVKETESLHKKSLNYEEIPFPPLTLNITSSPEEFFKYPYIEAFQDPEKMMVNEVLGKGFANINIYQSVRLKDHYPLGIRSNYGVGIIASMFGLKCKIIGENMPWVDPVDNIEMVRDIIKNGVPDVHSGLGHRVFDTNLFYKEKLSKFPKCARAIHITQPDMEGPFSIAELILGSQIYNQLYENPDMIHRLLDLITETYIDFLEEVRPTTTESVDSNFIYLHGAIIRGRCLLKDDSSVNISPDMYREFVQPYNKRILEKAGGGGIHSCGNRNPWRECLLETPGVMCLDFGDPHMNDMERWYEEAKEKRIAIPRFVISKEQLFNESFRNRFRTGISLFINIDTFEEAQDLLNRHINYE